MKFRFRNNKLHVGVEFIKGKNRYAAWSTIDTGSSITIIPPEIANYLELELDKENPMIKIVTGSGILEIPRKIAEAMKIDNLIFTNFPVGVHEIPKEVETRVLIGMDIINQIKLIIDGRNRDFEIIS